jgi:FixJ family two-component response regulator
LKTSEPHIFIVDDDPSVSSALKRLMKAAGFTHVRTFSSAEEFLKRETGKGGHLLILDIMLPGISGIDLQKFIRVGGLVGSTVFISAHESELERARKKFPEALGFLLKPFGGEELLKIVRSFFCRRFNTNKRGDKT